MGVQCLWEITNHFVVFSDVWVLTQYFIFFYRRLNGSLKSAARDASSNQGAEAVYGLKLTEGQGQENSGRTIGVQEGGASPGSCVIV